MAGALSGIKVIDFGQYISGPLAAMMLGDHGAEVIRVEPPDGPHWKSHANAVLNRGKQLIVLDAKNEKDNSIGRSLITSADIVIENFRPNVMNRLGWGPSVMAKANPRLIYCSLPGFATDDPRAQMPAWEGIVSAATDTYRPASNNTDTDRYNPTIISDRPSYTAIPIASSFTAFLAVTSIVNALVARERLGLGQHIEIPMFDAMFTAIGARGMSGEGAGDPSRTSDIWGGGRYQCSDGRWVQFMTHNPRFIEALLKVGKVSEWGKEGMLNRNLLKSEPALLVELRKRITDLFKTRPALEWENLMNDAGAPVCMLRSTQEWMNTEHANISQAVLTMNDPEYGWMKQPGLSVRLYGTSPVIRPRTLVASDFDGGSEDQNSTDNQPKVTDNITLPGALTGIKVLDLTQVLAGPTAGRTLAEFGADVIKINNPEDPPEGYRYHIDVNRGKKTILLDLKSEHGMEVLWKLINTTDVLLQNFTLGVAERLGFGYEQVKVRRPDIIYASVSAFGHCGPWGNRRGYEPHGQGITGIQERFGRGNTPAMQPFAVTDYGTGILTAFGIGLALYHRLRTGEGQVVEGSLAYTGTYLQTVFLQEYDGKIWNEPSGTESLGSSPLHRLYQAHEGWLFFAAKPNDLSKLQGIQGLEELSNISEDSIAKRLEMVIANGTVSEWVDQFNKCGIAAHALTPVQALMTDPWVTQHGLSTSRIHEGIGTVTAVGPSPRLSLTPVRSGNPVRPPGADTKAVIEDLTPKIPPTTRSHQRIV